MARTCSSPQRSPGVLDFAAALADGARSWQAEDGVDAVLHSVVRTAVIIIPGARRASVCVLGPRRAVATAAHSDDLIGAADREQCRLGEGPRVDAVLRYDTCRIDDLELDGRWAAFGRLAAGMGLRSLLCCPLIVPGGCLGALTLGSDRAAAFDARAEQLSGLFAAHAAIAVRTAQRDEQLRQALTTRDLIGQAKGILMQRHRVSGDEAFDKLTRTSQETNMKLRDVAWYVVEHAERAAPRARLGSPEARAGVRPARTAAAS